MFESFWAKIIAIVTAPVILLSSFFAPAPDPTIELNKQIEELRAKIREYQAEPLAFIPEIEELKQVDKAFASTKGKFGLTRVRFVSGRTYRLAGSGVDADDTSLTLSTFNLPQGSQRISMDDFGTIGYGVIDPGNPDRREIVSFAAMTVGSDNSVTLTGVTRGLAFNTPYTSSTTLGIAHSGGSLFIISNPPQLYNQAAFKLNDETIEGAWQFATTVPSVSSTAADNATNTLQLATRAYANSLAIANQVPAATNTIGFVEIGTAFEVASTTWRANSTTTVDARNVLHTGLTSLGFESLSTSTIPATLVNGKLHPNFIATTSDFQYNWASPSLFSGSTTLAVGATTTFASRVFAPNAASTTFGYFAIDQGSGDTYVIHLEPRPTLTQGLRFYFRPNATNTQDATINVNNLGATTIVRQNGTNLITGDIGTGRIAELFYDGTNFQLVNPQAAQTTYLFNSASSTVISQVAAPTAWTDIQLGNIVGTTSRIVMLSAWNSSDGVASYGFRQNVNGKVLNDQGSTGVSSCSSAGSGACYAIVPTDGDGIIEWIANVGDATTITVIAYW